MYQGGGNGMERGLGYMFLPSRTPPRQETVEVTPTTQWWIPVLQGATVFAVMAMAVNLSMAAVAAWGELGQPLIAVGCVAMMVFLLWRLAGSVEDEDEQSLMSPEAQRSRLGLSVIMVFLLAGVAGGLAISAFQLIQGFPSYQMVRFMIVGLGAPLCIVLGIWMTVKVGLQQGMVWMAVLGALVAVGYLSMEAISLMAEYAWGLTIVAGSMDFAAPLLIIAFKRELNNPWDPPSPDDRIRLAFLEAYLRKMQFEMGDMEPLPAIEVNIPGRFGARMLRFQDIPAAELAQFASHALTDTLAIDVTLPKRQFGQIRDQALGAGLVVWRNPKYKKKVVATVAGKNVFGAILDELGG